LANATISDYLIIPKNVSPSKCIELLITDPNEGFHLVRDIKDNARPNTIHMKDLTEWGDSKRAPELFGKISFMALNAKKDLLAFYTEAETKGRIIVLKADLS